MSGASAAFRGDVGEEHQQRRCVALLFKSAKINNYRSIVIAIVCMRPQHSNEFISQPIAISGPRNGADSLENAKFITFCLKINLAICKYIT
jgi:hypothetical protein